MIIRVQHLKNHFLPIFILVLLSPALVLADECPWLVREIEPDISHSFIGIGETGLDDPRDNVIHFNLDEVPQSSLNYWLDFSLFGTEDLSSIGISINDMQAIGGSLLRENKAWTDQHILLNPSTLKKGDNVIRFSLKNIGQLQLQTKDLKIRIEHPVQQIKTQIQLQQTAFYENAGYISGFLKGQNANCASIYLDEILLENVDGNFEFHLDKNYRKNTNAILRVNFSDNSAEELCIPFPTGILPEVKVFADEYKKGVRTGVLASPGRQQQINFLASRLTIPKEALLQPEEIRVTALREIDVAAVNGGIYNVTDKVSAYRFLPHGAKFERDLALTLSYSAEDIPQGYTEADLRIMYFDERDRLWKALPNGSINTECREITAPTDHFTDFIAGVISVPETPETESLLPTALSSIPHASPAAGIDFIAPPTAEYSGNANLRFPIRIPEGRMGMTPNLSLAYSSEGSNGWCGMGWDLSLPSITIDTRWGVPRYSATIESETYLYNGKQLAPVAHRGVIENRTAEKQFYLRIEGNFERIIRHGNSPRNYWWEITDKSGVVRYYGGSPTEGLNEAAVLKDESGNIAHWPLLAERDLHGNTINYTYTVVHDSGTPGSSQPGYQIYPAEIHYTGFGEEQGAYHVRFVRDRQMGEELRQDIGISARYGFKQVNADLLRKIEVRFRDTLIRAFELEYVSGAFYKSLLQDVIVRDENGDEFYRHSLEYHQDATSGGAYTLFGEQETWDSPADNVRGEILSANSLFPNETSVLGGSSTNDWSIGGAVTVGPLGNLAAKTNTAGGNFTYGSASGQGLIAFVDINGDGLPDKVFQDENKLSYRPNLMVASGSPAFGEERSIQGISQFSKSKTDSYAIGVEAHPGGAFVGYTNTTVTTTVSTYFSDFNGDGLMDVALEGKVYFNHINASGDPVFSLNSADTPSPIESGGSIDNDLFTIDPDELEDKIDASPLHDLVRMWEAPFDGQIDITGTVRLLDDPGTQSQAYDKKDGVRVAIQIRGDERWSATIEADDFAPKTPSNVGSINVSKGDRVYFRVQSRFDGAYDQVLWNPTITYRNVDQEEPDANGKKNYVYNSAEDFILASNQVVSMPKDGTIQISGRFSKPVTSDDVQLLVTKESDIAPFLQVILDTTIVWDSAVVLDILRQDIPVRENDEISCRAVAATNVEWPEIQWMPAITYTAASDGSPVISPEGIPLLTYCPAPDYSIFAETIEKSTPWIAPSSGTLTINGNLAFLNSPNGLARFSVKGIRSLLASRSVPVTNGNANFGAPIQLDVAAGDTLFFEFHTSDRALLIFLLTHSVDLDLAGNPESLTTGFHSVRDEEDVIFGPLYRGWGQFVYNGNRDRALQPINESELMIDGDIADGAEDIEDIEDPDDISNPYSAASEPFIVMISDPKNRYWVGSDNLTWIRRDTLSSSRFGEDDLLPPQFDGGGTTLIVPGIVTKSYINSVAGGGGAGPASASGSVAFNTTENQIDILDLNGDRYPDIVTREMAQYTTERGGFEEEAVSHTLEGHRAESFAFGLSAGIGYVHSSATNSGDSNSAGASAGSRGAMRSGGSTASSGSTRSASSGGAKSNTAKSGKKSSDASKASKSSAGIDGGFTMDWDSTAQTWMDINGDGLVDMLYKDGNVALNLGYRFAAKEQWGFPSIREGESRDYGGGLGVNLFNGSIVSGVSINRTDNYTDQAISDLNGDGLPDLITGVDPLKVRLNKGNGFGGEITWGGADQFEQGTATGESVNGAFTVCVPIVIFGIRICVNPSASTGRGVSRITQQLGDIDGDGFPDHLRSENDGELSVRRSTIGQTNLLKTIHRPLGATISLSYKPEGNTYDMPYSKWVLAEVEVHDGVAGDGVDLRKTAFRYSEGRYERHEREFLGFGKVEVEELDTENGDALYRKTALEYSTSDYYSKGLKIAETLFDAEGNPFTEMRNSYVLLDVLSGTPLPPLAAQSDHGMAFPALVETRELYIEGDVSTIISSGVNYAYDSYGNVVHFTDHGDGTEADRFETFIDYHYDLPSHLLSIPATVETVSSGQQMRYREQDIDSEGNILQVRKFLSPNLPVITDFTFDQYGNITGVTKPENHLGERLSYTITWDDQVAQFPIAVSDSYGYTSSASYDYKYGEMLESIDINENKVQYKLDSRGRIISISGPLEIESDSPYSISYVYRPEATPAYAETHRFDAQHQGDILTVAIVDGLGREIQSKKTGVLSNGAAQDSEVTIVSGTDIFDAFGRKVENYYPLTEAPGSVAYNSSLDQVAPTRVMWDVLDRATAFILPDGAETQIDFDIQPDNSGENRLAMTTTDALGNITAEYRDTRKRVRAEMALGPNGEIWTNYLYNALSETTGVLDNESNATAYTYDRLGRRVQIDHPDAGTSTFNYDLAGNLIGKSSDKMQEELSADAAILYTYDRERLVEINYPKNFQNKVQLHYGDADAEFNRRGRVWLREDASGGEEFFYDPLGQTSKTIRTLLVSQSNLQTYVTEYKFDSWGRLLQLRYPDGEIVDYSYNKAGMLQKIQGLKSGITYPYVLNIGYDKFEERVFMKLGNNSQMHYSYEPDRRRVSQSMASNAQGMEFMHNSYRYDPVDNLLATENSAAGLEGQPGGASSYSYQYDNLHRIERAEGQWTGISGETRSYTIEMRYDDLYNILEKKQKVTINEEPDLYNSYSLEYDYEGTGPHTPSEISGREMHYDLSGNLRATRGNTAFTFSQLLWDEENRLRGVSNNGYISQYTYDGQSERVLKSHGGQQGVFVDGAPAGSIDHLENYTAYVNPYLTVERGRFTKHYFAGEQKVLSKIGTGKFNFDLIGQGSLLTAGGLDYKRRMQLLSQAQDSYYAGLGIPPGPPTLQGYYGQPELTGNPLQGSDGGTYSTVPPNWPGPPGPPDPNGPPGPPVWFAQPQGPEDVRAGYAFDSTATGIHPELDAFFYHADPLGSVHYLTDWNGQIRQHTQYTPFGEVFVEEHTSTDSHPYKFNGKELDAETGYYYYGARYYDPRFSMWNSVDPLTEQFPGMSPYAYNFQNSMRYIDPDGRAPGELFSSPTKAAKDFAKVYNPPSIAENLEYGSSIYTVNLKGKSYFTYSVPTRSTEEDGVTPSKAPSGFTVVADVHTHSAYAPKFDNDIFSDDDINDNNKEGTVGYVATPRGRLLKYDPATGKETIVSKSIPFDKNHPKVKKELARTKTTKRTKGLKSHNAKLHLKGGSGARN